MVGLRSFEISGLDFEGGDEVAVALCAFFQKQKCADGMSCAFCQLYTPGEKKRRQREKIERAKEAWRAKGGVVDRLVVVLSSSSSSSSSSASPCMWPFFPKCFARSSTGHNDDDSDATREEERQTERTGEGERETERV